MSSSCSKIPLIFRKRPYLHQLRSFLFRRLKGNSMASSPDMTSQNFLYPDDQDQIRCHDCGCYQASRELFCHLRHHGNIVSLRGCPVEVQCCFDWVLSGLTTLVSRARSFPIKGGNIRMVSRVNVFLCKTRVTGAKKRKSGCLRTKRGSTNSMRRKGRGLIWEMRYLT